MSTGQGPAFETLKPFTQSHNLRKHVNLYDAGPASWTDRAAVYVSSLIICGGPFWVPALTYTMVGRRMGRWLVPEEADDGENLEILKEHSVEGGTTEASETMRRHRLLQYVRSGLLRLRRRRALRAALRRIASIFSTAVLLLAVGYGPMPWRHPAVGERLRFLSWPLWRSWARYLQMRVVRDLSLGGDAPADTPTDVGGGQAIVAMSPHGLFPFGLAMPEVTREETGDFFVVPTPGRGGARRARPLRTVVASQTAILPIIRTILSWINSVDAGHKNVDAALRGGDSLAIAPGGISEIFAGFPSAGYEKNDEAVLLKNRRGFIRMAARHRVPVLPVYVFGASGNFRRVGLPGIFEKLSKLLRISIVLFFGRLGLPIAIVGRGLHYVIGNPIMPPSDSIGEDAAVRKMHDDFCKEMAGIFERYKSKYGWGHKRLRIV